MFTKAKDPTQREPAMPQATPMVRKTPRSAPSIVSADMVIVGAITAGGDIQVDGKVEGDIVTDSLTVGENAMIKGEVLAEEVVVRGIVEGSIKAEKVQLCAGARVHGDILHAALAVETGALFEGNCRHSPDPLGRKSENPGAERLARMETAPAPKPAPAEPESKPEIKRPAPRVEPQVGSASSPAAKFKPSPGSDGSSRSSANGSNGGSGSDSKPSGSNDLGKISPGRMRAGAEDHLPAASTKSK